MCEVRGGGCSIRVVRARIIFGGEVALLFEVPEGNRGVFQSNRRGRVVVLPLVGGQFLLF